MSLARYRPDIDGLRAIAVTMVLAVHAFPSRFPNGYVGVDVFFVISGYLITGILLRELNSREFSIKNFYARRVNRIFPSLILVLCFVLGLGLLLMYSGEYVQMARSVWASALFAANINFYLESGYWDVASKLKPLLHLWSLGVEEQFYLVWPILLVIGLLRRWSFLVTAVALVIASFALSLFLTDINQPAAFYLPFGRLWELGVGGVLAGMVERRSNVLSPHDSFTSQKLGAVLGWGGLAMLAVTQVVPMKADAFPGYYAIVIVMASAFVIAAGGNAWSNRYILGNPFMVYIGKISYPLYLWHWPLLVFARLVGDGQWSSRNRNIAVIGAVILAMISYHFVERPLSKRVTRRGVSAGILVALMAVLGVIAALIDLKLLPFAPKPYHNAALEGYERPVIRSKGKVALLGDSNAGHMEYGLLLLYPDRMVTFATPAWPYLEDTRYKPGYVPGRGHVGSPELTEKALREIEGNKEIRLVVLSNAYLMYLPGDNLRSVSGNGATETVAQAYEAGMKKTVQRLREAGKKVLIVRSIPTYPMLATVMACDNGVRPALRTKPAECERPRSVVNQEREQYDGIIQRVLDAEPGVEVFDTLAELCDQQRCYVNRDDIQWYIDSGHYTTAGSQLMGAAVARKVEQMLSAR